MDLNNFVEIPEYPRYLISKDGQVYSTVSNKLLKIRVNNKGYLFFSVNGGTVNILLSRALARVFKDLPSLDSELEVDHIDCNVENNELDNLQVLTREQHRLKTIAEKGWRGSKNKTCRVCGVDITPGASYCREHYISSKSNTSISVKDIEYWVSNYSWSRASRELGMSDNGLRKLYTRVTGKDYRDIKKVKKSLVKH